MNTALIIAGGSGQRMKQEIPKQFLNVRDKPVIVYTMEAFQKHYDIDGIVVVCIRGWESILKAYAKQFHIDKLRGIAMGGSNGQESIKNGLLKIKELCSDDTMVLIHDAIRPMISQEIISDSIATCKVKGSAIAAIPCQEAMLETDDKIIAKGSYPREKLMRTQTPQTFYLSSLLEAHEEAEKRNIKNSVATCTLMNDLGREMYFSAGSEKNLKLTTMDDMELFKALLNSKEN